MLQSPLSGEVGNGEGYIYVGTEGIWETSVISQFYWEIKISINSEMKNAFHGSLLLNMAKKTTSEFQEANRNPQNWKAKRNEKQRETKSWKKGT